MVGITDIWERGIYTDLIRKFMTEGHRLHVVSPAERRMQQPTHLIEEGNCRLLRVKTTNLQKTNSIEKGIGQLMLERNFGRAIKKHLGDVDFDLIIYTTPPITFNRIIKQQKKKSGAVAYLMLKDIFPQNAVDLGMISKGSLLHRLLRRKERNLYETSDHIGCMSPANRDYLLRENPSVAASKVEICPNSIEPVELPPLSEAERHHRRSTYGIPADKTVFVYGGNLGKPQSVNFLLDVIAANEQSRNSHIVIVGDGTEYHRISRWFNSNHPANATLLYAMPKREYDEFIRAYDVGMIFLDQRFTIPNYPSRLLSYLECSMPVIMATDTSSDIGPIATRNGYGLWSESGSLKPYMENMERLAASAPLRSEMGERGKRFLLDNYTVDKTYATIISHFKQQ